MIYKTNMFLNESITVVSWAGLSKSYLFLMIPFSRVFSQMGQQDGHMKPCINLGTILADLVRASK